MPNTTVPVSLPDVATIQLHQDAKQLADTLAANHRNEIIQMARILAVQDSANQVQSGHIEWARVIIRRAPPQSHLTKAALIVGGAFFGAFVQGFIEALADGKPTLIVIYVILGFLGMGLVFGALLKR